MSRRVLIDCDPGHDDAMALLYAARHLSLAAITTVFGNASLANTTRNALAICELAGIDVPVSSGCDRPLAGQAHSAVHMHGRTGIDGAQLPEPRRELTGRHAVDVIIDTARQHAGALSLVALGPLTNLATALRTEPALAGWLEGISLMGGSTDAGNITPHAEFNIACDPDAAAVVFTSGVPIRMVGLNVTRQAGISAAHIARLRASGGLLARTFADLLDFYLQRSRARYVRDTAAMHDPCALLDLVQPGLIEWRATHVHVECLSPQLRGMTACDLRDLRADAAAQPGATQPPNAQVAIGIDGATAVDRVLDCLIDADRARA